MNRIYLDTNIWIYHFENVPRLGAFAGKLIINAVSRKEEIILSSLFFSEFLAPKSKAPRNWFDSLINDLQAIPALSIEDVTTRIAYEAGLLRQEYKLKTPDAIHLATAIRRGCKVFYTHDKALQKVKEIKVELLK